jgi:hypothetical protein
MSPTGTYSCLDNGIEDEKIRRKKLQPLIAEKPTRD